MLSLGSPPSMRYLLVLATLVCCLAATCALSASEEGALQEVFAAWPDFGRQPLPWSLNFSSACDPPGFRGVTCSNDSDPHVIGLYVLISSSCPSFPPPSQLSILAFRHLAQRTASNPFKRSIESSNPSKPLLGWIPKEIDGLIWLETLYASFAQ